MKRTLRLLCWLAILALMVGCKTKTQKEQETQSIVDEMIKQLQSECLARIEYANSYRQYLRDCCSKPGVILDVETRSTKSDYFRNQQDILILRCGDETCMRTAKDAFLEVADAKKLKDLKFRLFMIGAINNRWFRAYDVDKEQWGAKRVAFCPPADACTTVEGVQ